MYCTICYSSNEVCSCEEPELTCEGYCENCGTIDSADGNDGFCEDCEDAREEYRDSVVFHIVDNIDLVLK